MGLKLFWFIKLKKIILFSYTTVVLHLCLIYVVKTVCWYVCLSLVFIISDQNIVYTSTRCLRRYAWLVCLLISSCLDFMTWHDLTWLGNLVCQCTCDKTMMSQHPESHFLIISSVLCKDGNDNYEQLVHWGVFGSNVWMHKDSTGQTMNQVMTPFQQRFGKPCLCGATLSVWEKVYLCRGIWRILLGAVDQYLEHWPVLWLPLSLNDRHASLQKRLHLTMFDHKRDLVMKSFWPVFVIELGDTGMRLCDKACTLLLEWFLVALSHGKVLFSDECAVYCSSLSWNVFGAKQNPCYTLEM